MSGLGYDSRCFAFSGGNVSPPPYTSPEPIVPRGTYTPLWRCYVGYYVFCPTVCPPDPMELHRVVGDLSTPDSALSLSVLAGGDTGAAPVQRFEVPGSGGVGTVAPSAQGD